MDTVNADIYCLQDRIQDLTRERDALQRQLTFDAQEFAIERVALETMLKAAREQRDQARKDSESHRNTMEVIEGRLRDEVQRRLAERAATQREHDDARTKWEKEKDALRTEIDDLKEKFRETISTEEARDLKGQLEMVKTDSLSLRNRLAQIQAALAEPSTTASSTRLGETETVVLKLWNEDVKPIDHKEATLSTHLGAFSARASSHSQHADDAGIIDLTHLEDSPRAKRKRQNSLSKCARSTFRPVSAKRQRTYPDGRADETAEFVQGSSRDMMKPSHQPTDQARLPNELPGNRLPPVEHAQQHGIILRDEPVAHHDRLDGSSDLDSSTSHGSKPAALSSEATSNYSTPNLPSSPKNLRYGLRARRKPPATQTCGTVSLRSAVSSSSPMNTDTIDLGLSTPPSESTSTSRKMDRTSAEKKITPKDESAVNDVPPLLRHSIYTFPTSLNDRVAKIASADVPLFPSPSDKNPYPGFYRRDFLAHHYGAPPQSFVGTANRDLKAAGSNRIRSLIFPKWDQNPGLPKIPGQPGTIIANRFDMVGGGPWNIFVRAYDKALWQCLGLYDTLVTDQPLTPEEFKACSPATRKSWAKAILDTKQKWTCYLSMRARMVLCKKGEEVTDELIQREIAHPSMTALSQQDVLDAVDRGTEILNIILLVPVGYDEEWRADMELRSTGSKSSSGGSSSVQRNKTRRTATSIRRTGPTLQSASAPVGSAADAARTSITLRTRRKSKILPAHLRENESGPDELDSDDCDDEGDGDFVG